MKKLLAIGIMSAMILTFTACSSQESEPVNNNTTVSTTEPTKSDIVDEKLLTVDINVPASMFDEENPATDELTQEQIDNGFKSAKLNEDGSVTYTMSKSAFNDYKKEIKEQTENSLNTLNSEYPCIDSVEFNDNFSEIKINVNKDEYENGMNFFCITVAGFSANIYQAYTNETVVSNISVIDKDTGEVIDSATYPTE